MPLGAPSQSPTPAVHSRPQGQPPSRTQSWPWVTAGPVHNEHSRVPCGYGASDASFISGDHHHQTKASTRVTVLVQEKGQK